MTIERYIIERRKENGALTLEGVQPEDVFGMAAIMGITEDAMAKIVWRYTPDAALTGENIAKWPTFIHSEFVARRKTW